MSTVRSLQIPVTASDLALFRRAASKHGLSVSDWALQFLRANAALEELFDLEAPIASTEQMIEESRRGRYD